ncbi:hypothetical protein EG329_012331 [Mollisiaceae sp. DMI_Dod_QoI]|nr:hypothetical protein EG329_012331 [Helotiales sp. DMI_Dod_QoI]
MPPTPVRASPHSASPPGRFPSFPAARGSRFDAERRNVTPTARAPFTPLVDEGEDAEQESDDDLEGEENNEDEDDGGGSELDEEGADGDEEEGAIEEVQPDLSGSGRARPQLAGWSPSVPMRQAAATPPTGETEAFSRLLVQLANQHPSVPMEVDVPFDAEALGLKEIGNLASWTVSSSKPGCGVKELRNDDTNLFWQSDGPQPHHLNIHFNRLVLIRAIRIYLDFEADESYTPTRITLLGGTGHHDLIPFSALSFEQPKGWIDVNLDHVGGGEDGKTLRVFLVQVRIVENHQNGKDTHVRGLKIYAKDDKARGTLGLDSLRVEVEGKGKAKSTPAKGQANGKERTWLLEPDWMGEPELR